MDCFEAEIRTMVDKDNGAHWYTLSKRNGFHNLEIRNRKGFTQKYGSTCSQEVVELERRDDF